MQAVKSQDPSPAWSVITQERRWCSPHLKAGKFLACRTEGRKEPMSPLEAARQEKFPLHHRIKQSNHPSIYGILELAGLESHPSLQEWWRESQRVRHFLHLWEVSRPWRSWGERCFPRNFTSSSCLFIVPSSRLRPQRAVAAQTRPVTDDIARALQIADTISPWFGCRKLGPSCIHSDSVLLSVFPQSP